MANVLKQMMVRELTRELKDAEGLLVVSMSDLTVAETEDLRDKLAERIQGGWTDFDIVITSPDMMKHVGKLGNVLGPQGKMPSPKSGTVTPDVASAVREFKAGKVEFRTDAGGNVHALLGKRSFPVEDLRQNLQAFLDHVSSLRPPAARGAFFRKISISTSMGPGVLIAWEVVHA